MTETHTAAQNRNLALQASLDSYLLSRRERIPLLLNKYLTLKDCTEIQSRHFVMDLLKNPLNTFWAIPSLAVRKVLEVAEKLGIDQAKMLLTHLPRSFKTDFHKEVERLLLVVLFELPEDKTAPSLLIRNIEAAAPLDIYFQSTEWKLLAVDSDREIRAQVAEYCHTQSGFTNLAASGGVLLAAKRFFGDGNLDVFGIGSRWAALWAREDAQSHFLFGKKLGKAFYKVVPPPPPTNLQFYTTTAITLALVALFCTLVNVLSLPAQSKLGFQQKQLEKLLAAVSDKLLLKFAKARLSS